MLELAIVAIGGAAGAVCRYLLGTLTASRFGTFLPFGTFFSNCIGCFIIGFFMMLALTRIDIGPGWRLLVVTGFCGGLTTFSSLSYETIRLAQTGGFQQALFNVAVNLLAGLILTVAGIWLAMKI